MNNLQIELTKLIGKKELSFGCVISSKQFHIYEEGDGYGTINRCTYFHNQGNIMLQKFRVMNPLTEEDEWYDFTDCTSFKIIGHPATLSDLHRYIVSIRDTEGNNIYCFKQNLLMILVGKVKPDSEIDPIELRYDFALDLLDQSEETLKKIIEFIKS